MGEATEILGGALPERGESPQGPPLSGRAKNPDFHVAVRVPICYTCGQGEKP